MLNRRAMMGMLGTGALAATANRPGRAGYAANAHLDLAISNFGIQEMRFLNQATQDVFRGPLSFKKGDMYVHEAPGFGVDIDEKLAARFPLPGQPDNWLPVRRCDGSAVRP